MRIVSFLPSATEMVCALGLEDQLVGITHECDYPDDVKAKPVVVRSAVRTNGLTPQQIDEAVSRRVRSGESLYLVDEDLLTALAPDVILTQDLCQVCAPSGNEVGRVLQFLQNTPRIVWLSPTCLNDIFENLKDVGTATGKSSEAASLVNELQGRVQCVSKKSERLTVRPRVFCMEWLAPPYSSGHWMPELVELAGGMDGLAQKGNPSIRVSWEHILDYAPEVLVLNPCGFDLNEAVSQAHCLTSYPGWERLPAVQQGRVYAVDANSYFARPGPRIVDGLELLAAILHPELFTWSGAVNVYRRLTQDEIATVSSRL